MVRRSPRRTRVVCTAAVVALVLVSCGSTGGKSAFMVKPGESTTTAPVAAGGTTTSPSLKASVGGTPTTASPARKQPVVTASTSGSGCTADQGLKPGRTQATIKSGGYLRTYVLYVPKHYRPGRPTPVVFNFHGLTSPIEGEELISGFHAKADEVTAIEVLPLGQGSGTPAWNVTKYPKWPQEKLFMNDLLDSIERQACVDTRRVYAMGLSNGAQMTSFVACNLANRFAAFAAVAGLMDLQGACHPSRPVSIIAFHGTADPFLPYAGGAGHGVGTLKLDAPTVAGIAAMGPLLKPIPEVFTAWARRDNCHGLPTETVVSPHVKRRAYGPKCSKGVDLVLYTIDGGGHTWPGSSGSAAVSKVVGFTTMEIKANDLIWTFFQQHPLPAT